MRKYLTGVAMLTLAMAVAGCDRKAAEDANATADANTVVVDENAAMDANAAMGANTIDANTVDANTAMNADEATENATKQGSTDH